jgi:hypothetical protein
LSGWLIGYSEQTWEYQLRNVDAIGFKNAATDFVRSAQAGDRAIAYVAGRSVIAGLFEIAGRSYVDSSPLYRPAGRDIYSTRFPVRATWVSSRQSEIDFRPIVGRLDLFKRLQDVRAWGGVMRNLPLRLSGHDLDILLTEIGVAQGARR